jgi:hypothetical protein
MSNFDPIDDLELEDIDMDKPIHPAAVNAARPQIPALWFDARGCGPSELALQPWWFSAEMDGAIPASLGIRIQVYQPAGDEKGLSMVSGAAKELVDSGFFLGRDQVVALHAQFAAWLEANP